jgi:hypothetical protein
MPASPSHSEQPVGSPPGAAGAAAQSAPASRHVSAHSPCRPVRPCRGSRCRTVHPRLFRHRPCSSGTSCVPDAAEAGEVSRPDLSSGGPALSPGISTRVIDTENGCVRATRVDGGAWYLSISDARHSVCAFLTEEDAALLFTPFRDSPHDRRSLHPDRCLCPRGRQSRRGAGHARHRDGAGALACDAWSALARRCGRGR